MGEKRVSGDSAGRLLHFVQKEVQSSLSSYFSPVRAVVSDVSKSTQSSGNKSAAASALTQSSGPKVKR